MTINAGVVAAQIHNLKDEWATLESRRWDRRTRRYKAERDRISSGIYNLTHIYAQATGMNHPAVLRHFELI